jgi:ADP-ribose pyrophosphatase YjhB (NUDIX family)
MASDCTVAIDNGYINLRVGAIIQKNGKFLMVGNQKDDYLYSVGGRIKFGESAKEAVVREVFEETGVKLEVDRLGFIHENFFYGDYGHKQDKLIYEISYYFYMRTPEDFESVSACRKYC